MFLEKLRSFIRRPSEGPTSKQPLTLAEQIVRRKEVWGRVAEELSSGKALTTDDLKRIYEKFGAPSTSISNLTGQFWAARAGYPEAGSFFESETGTGVELKYYGRRVILLPRDVDEQTKQNALRAAKDRVDQAKGKK